MEECKLYSIEKSQKPKHRLKWFVQWLPLNKYEAMGLTFYHVIILYIYASAINIPTKRMTDLELHIEKMTSPWKNYK